MAKFSIVLTSSLRGELARKSAASRSGAYRTAVMLINRRADAEARKEAATMHREVISLRVEQDDGPPAA